VLLVSLGTIAFPLSMLLCKTLIFECLGTVACKIGFLLLHLKNSEHGTMSASFGANTCAFVIPTRSQQSLAKSVSSLFRPEKILSRPHQPFLAPTPYRRFCTVPN